MRIYISLSLSKHRSRFLFVVVVFWLGEITGVSPCPAPARSLLVLHVRPQSAVWHQFSLSSLLTSQLTSQPGHVPVEVLQPGDAGSPEEDPQPRPASQHPGALLQPDQGGGLSPGSQVSSFLLLLLLLLLTALFYSEYSAPVFSLTRATSPTWPGTTTTSTSPTSSPPWRGTGWSSSSRTSSAWTWRPTYLSPTSLEVERMVWMIWRKGCQLGCQIPRLSGERFVCFYLFSQI